MKITDAMKQAGARALVNLGLQPCVFGADAIAETVFREMLEAREKDSVADALGILDEVKKLILDEPAGPA